MKTNMRRVARLAAFTLAAAMAHGAHAATTVLAMDSLPTAQGWTYGSCYWGCLVPAAEDAWVADGASLSLHAYHGAQGFSVTNFSLPWAVDPTLPFTIDTTLRIVSSSGTFFYLGASTATQSVFVGLSTSALQVESTAGGASSVLDAAVFHDYQIAAEPGGIVTVKVDGATVYAGVEAWLTIDPHTSPNSIEFGDGGSGVYGTAVMTRYSFTQTAAVPEPAGLTLMAAGLAALLWRRRSAAQR